MKQENAKDLYELYDRFIQDFLFDKNSILSNHKDILSQSSLQSVIHHFLDEYEAGDASFDEKIEKQFRDADINTRLVFAHAEWLWAYSVKDITQKTKKRYAERSTKLESENLNNDVFPVGFGSAGRWHTNNKYWEIQFLIYLIQYLHQKIEAGEIKSLSEAKQWIEQICLYHSYGEEVNGYELSDVFKEKLRDKKLAMVNILTYLGAPERYERIASNSHKQQIYSTFKGLLSEEQNSKDMNLDVRIYNIRKRITELSNNKEIDFYDPRFQNAWYEYGTENFDELRGLLYKKAIILYGPPGTSKTHGAKKIAKAILTYHSLKKNKDLIQYLSGDHEHLEGRIHHLQLHPNYSYEDFIAGYQLKNGETRLEKGVLFDICHAAKDDLGSSPEHDKHHVLILDEINRIDLSRLFGEVFSALENRDQPIRLGIGGLALTIPRNLYVIGTMNEIDFSLERIDFALRRRFLWYFYGFNEDILRSIIEEKNEDLNTHLKMEEEVNRFIQNAQKLNDRISSIPELGKKHHIGHTFFGEIVNIYQGYKEFENKGRLRKQLFRKDGPVQILWDLSILPMLKSYLGYIDSESSQKILSELEEIYFHES
jgi:5-methylcytosine-specific restriction protein B